MAASSSDAELSQLLAALVSEFPGIVTDATPINGPKPGVFACLACKHNHPGCRSEQVQIAPSKGRHNQIDCVPALKELLTSKHAACIAEIQAERDAELAEAARQEQLLSFGTMMAAQKKKQSDEQHAAAVKLAKERIQQTRQQASSAQLKAAEARRAEELAAEPYVAATRAADAEAVLLEAQFAAAKAALDELQPDEKRQRAEEEDEDDELTLPPNEWGRTTFVREETRDSNRRSVPIRHDAPQLPMKDGTSDGYMTHPRHGIAGNVQRWARGSRDNVIKIILRLIKWFGVEDDIRKSFGEKAAKTASIDALIVDRVAAVLQVLKEGGSEQVRIAYRIVLAAIAPPLVEQGHHGDDGKFDGAAAAVAARVGVTPGRRPVSAGRGAPPPAAAYPGDGVGDPGGLGRRGAKGVLVNRIERILACLGVT